LNGTPATKTAANRLQMSDELETMSRNRLFASGLAFGTAMIGGFAGFASITSAGTSFAFARGHRGPF
jgi:hypothetical protein